MNIVCIGGGPAGLYFSLLMKKQKPEHRITVIERNRPYDTFGWGVVFSDQTLGNLANADEPTARAILQAFNHWDDIEIHFKGETVRSGGHGFCGIGRKRLLNILQARCEELGVQLVFETEVQDDQAIAKQYGADLVIASDGLNSRIRMRYAASYQPEIEQRHCASSGWARARNSRRLRLPSARRHTAGSRRISINMTAIRRPSSSKRRNTCGARRGSMP